MDTQKDATLTQLLKRREQAQYEADRARRQYEAVEPENRLVARTVESEWNRRLATLAEIDNQIEERRNHKPTPLSDKERQRLLVLGLDLRHVWEASTTTVQERKRLLQAVFEDIFVRVNRESRIADVTLMWQGGEITELKIKMPRLGDRSRVDDTAVIEDVRKMAELMTDAQIAGTLCRRGIRTPTGLVYNVPRVLGLRKRHGIPEYTPKPSDDDEPVYNAEEVAAKLGVSHFTVLRWLKEGFLVGHQVAPSAPWRIKLGAVKKINVAARAPKGWLPPKAAAKALGVSRRTVLHWVQIGKLEAVLAGKGRRSGLRINVISASCNKQQSLFVNPSTRGHV